MELTLGTGIFWIIIASTVGETIVRVAKAIGKRRAGDAAAGGTLERRVEELERVVTQQLETQQEQDEVIGRLRQQLEFTEQLLARRQTPSLEH